MPIPENEVLGTGRDWHQYSRPLMMTSSWHK